MHDALVWQLVDSAFPTGAFAHSLGLESAWQHGEVVSRDDLRRFVEATILQAASGALPLVNAAHREPSRLAGVGRLERRVPDQRGRQPRQPAAGTHAARERVRGSGRRRRWRRASHRRPARNAQLLRAMRRRSPASVFAHARRLARDDAARRPVRGRARRAVRRGAARRHRQLRRAAPAVGVRRAGRRPCWRATATPAPPTWRRPRHSSTSCRGRTTGSTRASSNPESIHTCTTSPARPYHGDPDSPGAFDERPAPLARDFHARAFTVGIGGPVGSGKTALLLALCRALRDDNNIAVVTNDIFTREDAEFLTRHQALAPERIAAVETGGCPHTAVRDDISQNLDALQQLMFAFQPELLFVESGGDNLAAQFSRELADFTIYVIDVSGGDKIPRKGGPGHHPVGPADHQQDRPGAARRRRPRRHGSRRAEDARHRAVPVHAGDARHRHPRDRAAHPGGARRGAQGGAGVGWTGDPDRSCGIAARRGGGASHSADGPRRRYRFVGPPAFFDRMFDAMCYAGFVETPAQPKP